VNDIPGKITQYTELIQAILTAAGPAIVSIKDSLGGLMDQLKSDDLLDPAAHAALLAQLDALDAAIERA